MCGVGIGLNDLKLVGEAGVGSLKNAPKEGKKKETEIDEAY